MPEAPNNPPKKIRRAELISPHNSIKEKVGSGGLDERILIKAQDMLEENKTDFAPIAGVLIELLENGIQHARSGTYKGERAIEEIIYPAMQIKAQGGMFHYALVSEMSNILINFLETVEAADADVLEIVVAHKMAINAVIAGKIKGDGGKTGKELSGALMDACNRYYKSRAG